MNGPIEKPNKASQGEQHPEERKNNEKTKREKEKKQKKDKKEKKGNNYYSGHHQSQTYKIKRLLRYHSYSNRMVGKCQLWLKFSGKQTTAILIKSIIVVGAYFCMKCPSAENLDYLIISWSASHFCTRTCFIKTQSRCTTTTLPVTSKVLI